MEGLRIGSFVVEAPLATGGMGAVWRAVHHSGVPAALKIIPADAESEMFEAALGLKAEIRAVGALDHPNIVRVYDAGLLTAEHEQASGGKLRAGSPWLAMELADGPIDQLQEGMDWSRLSNILLQVLDGLAHAHARGMVHRDLKPANVLYTRGEGGLRVLLADFGLAWRFKRDDPLVHGGSLPYAAPEQLLAQQCELGPWTDLYGLGCVAFRLATGKRPFRGKDPDAIRRAHLFGDRPTVKAKFPISEGFEGWVHGMLAKEPRARFQRAADAAWALVRLPPPKASARVEEEDDSDVPSVSVQALSRDRTMTLPLSQWVLLGGRTEEIASAAASVRAPRPDDWRRPSDLRSVPLEGGRGLGLFGLLDPPMIGRFDERHRLWEELTKSRGFRFVVLRGAQGVGKTRLASWLCERGHEVGVAEVFRAVFRQSGGGEAEGLGGLVEEHLRIQGLMGSELLRELRITLRAEGVVDTQVATTLAHLLRPSDPAFGAEPLEPSERFAAVADVIRRRTSGRRALIWLEDAFWRSEGVAFAEHLAEHLAGDVVVVLTMRDDLVAPAVAQRAKRLVETRGGAELRLAPLAAGQVAELVHALLPARDDLPERIEAKAGGNPAIAVQLTAELVAKGQIEGDAGGVWLRDDVMPLPDAARWRETLAALAAVDPTLAHALRVAAALGSSVVYAEWRDACRLLDLALPQTGVATMVDRGFLIAERRSGNRWTFAHEALHQVLLEAAAEDGPGLQLACAEALSSRGAALAHRAAVHFEAAGARARAIDAWGEALGWSVDWDRARAVDAAGRWRKALQATGDPTDPRWAAGLGHLVDLHAPAGGVAHREAVAELAAFGKHDRVAELRAWVEQAGLDLRANLVSRAVARAELAFHRSKGTKERSRAVVVRAEVRRVTGDAQGAADFFETWLPELDPEDQEVVIAHARFVSAAGRHDDALRLLTSFIDRQTRAQAPMARARVQHARGAILAAVGRHREALAALEEADGMRSRAGFEWPALQLDFARTQLAAGRPVTTQSVESLVACFTPEADGRARGEALALLDRVRGGSPTKVGLDAPARPE